MTPVKRILVLAFIAALSLNASAQKSPVDDLFDRYDGKEGFTSVYISSRMVGLLSNIDTEDKEFHDLVTRIKAIRILSADSTMNLTGINFAGELQNKLTSAGYEDLMTVREKDEVIRFMIREVNGMITELVMITGGSGNSVVSIRGDLDLKTIAGLSDNLGVDGLQDLDKVKR